jgi:hypothetical protein
VEEGNHLARPVVMNSAIHQLSASQMQRDALRMSLREPRLPGSEKPERASSRRGRLAFVFRLRAALA